MASGAAITGTNAVIHVTAAACRGIPRWQNHVGINPDLVPLPAEEKRQGAVGIDPEIALMQRPASVPLGVNRRRRSGAVVNDRVAMVAAATSTTTSTTHRGALTA